ncbi:phage tail tape measure protein [Moraxella canis]|uniref:Phage tail tape measure protein n=1 Tax=Moraxella canis TaxID=90239 RepID=A0A1S9ZKE4_9GAMM|nr:phage tail tape measure protein [Moraxella canis]OOR83916.1 phage tail tape measure protein [Moraxella canis]
MSTVSKLQIVLEATTTAFDRGMKQASDNLNAFAKKNEEIHNRLDRFSRKYEKALGTFRAVGAASAAGLVAIGAGIKSTTDEAMKFESALAEVKKVVDFDTPDGLVNMRRELENLSTQVPIAFDGLAKIAAAAGQSGIAADEIVKFTEAAAKMGTAFDITAEEAGQAMAEMRTAFKMSQTEVETLADKINYLGNNSPNAAANIMQVVQTIGPLGEIAGVSSDQIAAMAASLTGVKPDVAATGLKNMMIQLTKGDSLAKSAKNAFTDLGLSYTDVAKGMQTDSVGTINKVLEAIKKLPAEAQTASINAIFGAEALPVVSQLVTGTETLTGHLQAMGDATKYAGSMNAEAANINATAAAQMEMFKNATQNAKAAIGDAFLPALAGIVEKLTPAINSIKEFAQENPKLISTITAVTGVILGLGVAIGAIGLAVPVVTAAFGGLAAVSGLVGAALGAVTLPMLAIGVAIAGVIAAGVALYKNWETVKAKAAEIFNNLPAPIKTAIDNIKSYFSGMMATLEVVLDAAKAFWHGFSTIPLAAFEVIKASVSFGMSAIGAIIKAALSGFATAFNLGFGLIKTTVSTVFNVIKALIRGDMEGVKAAIGNGAKAAVNIFKQFGRDVLATFKTLGTSLTQAGRDAVQGLINGINEKIGAAVAKAKDLASNVKNAITKFLDIRSPSRVMKQLGEWAAEGFAIGIANKAPLVAKQAKDLAKQAKDAVINEVAALKRDIALFNNDNPLFAFGYDKGVGKYHSEDTSQLEQLIAQKYQLERNQAVLDEIDRIHQSVVTSQMSQLEILDWEITNTKKYQDVSREVLDDLRERLKIQIDVNAAMDVGKIRDETLMIGKNEIEQLQHKLATAKDYRDISQNIKDMYVEQSRAKIFVTKQSAVQLELEKKLFMLRNANNPLAEAQWSLSQSGLTSEQQQAILSIEAQSQLVDKFSKLQEDLKAGTVFTMPTFGNSSGLQGVSDALIAGINSAAEMDKQYQEQLQIISDARQAQLDINADYDQQERDLLAAHLAAKRELTILSAEHITSGLSSAAKSMFGEQSKAYRALFALEQSVAIARSGVAIQQAIALASANPFPMNLAAMGTVVAQTASIIARIKSFKNPVVGQAHDGIPSVPREGTWILDKGERVVKPRDNDRLTKFLDNPNRFMRGESKVIINNYSGEPATATQDQNGDLIVTIGKMVGDAIDYKLAERDAKSHRQGWGY